MSGAQAEHSRLAEPARKPGLHEHLCLIYETKEEQSAAAVAYLKAGLERGEKCVYIADENTTAGVLEALRRCGADVEHYLRAGALTVVCKTEVFLQTGNFDPDRIIHFWTQAVTKAGANEFSGMSTLVAEMTWALGGSDDARRIIEYEGKGNQFVRDYNVCVVCQYSRSCLPPEVILGIICAHPLVAYGGLVCKNPYYLPPDQLLKPNQASQEVELLLHNILAWELAQKALRQSDERWRAVVENSAVGIALTDSQGRFLSSNRTFQELVGYTDENLRALSFLDITYEEDRETNRALANELMEGKRRQFSLEKRYRRKDGNLIWVRATVSEALGTDGKFRFGMEIVEEITERKRAEEAMRRTEAYLAAGQKLSHTGSWALNVRSGELFWSQETYRIFGFDPAKTSASVNETFLPRIHPEDRSKVEEGLKAATVQRESYAVHYRIVLPNGSIKHIRDVVYPVTGEAGDVVERYGVIMDVTERYRAEAELRRMCEQLQAVARRLQSVREEERARLAREIHDQLGQAMAGIRMGLGALGNELPADKKQRVEAVLNLVDETIQSVRRISTELRPVILDAAGLVGAIEWAAADFTARTGIKCSLDLLDTDIVTASDIAAELLRIFQEALTNVARHANATEVNVRVAKEGRDLTLEVHDNGQGISEDRLSAGSSLGILGMRDRALLLGGQLTITGAPGKGTTVRVQIPHARH